MTWRLACTAFIAAAVLCAGAPSAVADESSPGPTPAPTAEPRGELPLRPGDTGPYLVHVHERLTWLGYRIADDEVEQTRFGASTARALEAFAEKFALPSQGVIDQRTWDEIKRTAGTVGSLPAACTNVAKAICLDTDQRVLRLVRNGTVTLTVDARFGVPGERTRLGTFRVQRRSEHHFSTLYRTSMPLALFFSGGQAIHFSPYFVRDGYAGGSHGCVNLRDRAAAQQIFDWAPLGTRVHIA